MALLDGLGQAFKKLDCAVLGSAGYLAGGLGRFTGLDQGLAEDAINGLRRIRGCPDAGDYVTPPPPFEGGQCFGPGYDFTFTATNVQGQRASSQQGTSGRLVGVEVRTDSGTGNQTAGYLKQESPGAPIDFVGLQIGNPGVDLNPVISNVVRRGGLPDDCGSLPPSYPPPTNINFDVDVTFTDGNDNIINVTIPVEFKPFTVNFNGDVLFPFDFNLGGVNFNGDVTFAPDFGLTLNPPRLPPGPINPPPSGSEPGVPVPLKPRGSKIQGVIVVANVISGQSVSSYEGSPVPDIYVPRLGSVKFAYSFGVATVWSNDIDVKGTAVFIPCPFSQGADAVQARPQPGVTFSLSAVEGPPLATVVDLG